MISKFLNIELASNFLGGPQGNWVGSVKADYVAYSILQASECSPSMHTACCQDIQIINLQGAAFFILSGSFVEVISSLIDKNQNFIDCVFVLVGY